MLPKLGLAIRPRMYYHTRMGMTLRDTLERIREANGWDMRRMARELLVSEATYRHYITGRNRAGRKIIGGVALAFPEVNVAWFAAQDIRGSATMAAEALDSQPSARAHGNE